MGGGFGNEVLRAILVVEFQGLRKRETVAVAKIGDDKSVFNENFLIHSPIVQEVDSSLSAEL